MKYTTIFKSLQNAGIRYVLIGGMAVVLHGYPRFTQDMDVVLDPDPANLDRFWSALDGLGFVPRVPVPRSEFLDPAVRDSWIRARNLRAFSFVCVQDPFFVVDVLLTIPFAGLTPVAIPIEGMPIPVIDRESLIRMKRATGRAQDVADAEMLEKGRA